jgi:hypothetical protein
MRIEAIGEMFNLFNAINPSVSVPASSSRRQARPTRCSFSRPATRATSVVEQRVGQIGLRFTF